MTDWFIAAAATFLAGTFFGGQLVLHMTKRMMQDGSIDARFVEEIRTRHRDRIARQVAQGKTKE